jgi:hypothetical protein
MTAMSAMGGKQTFALITSSHDHISYDCSGGIRSDPLQHWTGLNGQKCPRCQSTHDKRLVSNHIRLPETGLIYFFAGEFAKDPKVWLIDLNNGAITQCASDDQTTCTSDGTISAVALKTIRVSALKVWARDWPHKGNGLVSLAYAPGTTDDCYIVSGKRMVSFSPLEKKDKALTDQVEQAIFRPTR